MDDLECEEIEIAHLKECKAISDDYDKRIQQLEADNARLCEENKKLRWNIGEQVKATADLTELYNRRTLAITQLRKAIAGAVEKMRKYIENRQEDINTFRRDDMARSVEYLDGTTREFEHMKYYIQQIAQDLEATIRE